MDTMLLTRILAQSDAVWYPLRDWSRPIPANVYFARKEFETFGVPWQSDGATEADRKAMQRALEQLVAERLVVVRRPMRVKTLAVKLTDEAEAMTRKLAAVPGAYSSWLAAQKIGEHSKRPDAAEFVADIYVSESHLIRAREPDEYRREAALVETMLLYALSRGLVASRSDRDGRVSYQLTELGWAWLDAGNVPADDLDGEPDEAAARLYCECRDIALHRIYTAQPRVPGELGGLPLPVAVQGVRLREAEPELTTVE